MSAGRGLFGSAGEFLFFLCQLFQCSLILPELLFCGEHLYILCALDFFGL